MECSVLNLDKSIGSPVKAVVFPFVIITVILNWATKSPVFSVRTGYGTNKLCSTHSLTPNLAVFSYSKAFKLKLNDGYLFKTSLKNCFLADSNIFFS